MGKILYIVRGVPGSGKTTFAETLDCPVHSADDYFYAVDGTYHFNADLIGTAHDYCFQRTKAAMQSQAEKVAVANTFTREWEMAKYIEAAERYGYTVFSLVVENRHNGENIHGIPEETVKKMKERFEIKL